MQNLKNRNAVVTGAARGIGEKIAHALAKEGMNIVLVDRLEQGPNHVPVSLLGEQREIDEVHERGEVARPHHEVHVRVPLDQLLAVLRGVEVAPARLVEEELVTAQEGRDGNAEGMVEPRMTLVDFIRAELGLAPDQPTTLLWTYCAETEAEATAETETEVEIEVETKSPSPEEHEEEREGGHRQIDACLLRQRLPLAYDRLHVFLDAQDGELRPEDDFRAIGDCCLRHRQVLVMNGLRFLPESGCAFFLKQFVIFAYVDFGYREGSDRNCVERANRWGG